jgi:hypothetical protein
LQSLCDIDANATAGWLVGWCSNACSSTGHGVITRKRKDAFNQREKERFMLPSRELFAGFCADLVARYRLSNDTHTDTDGATGHSHNAGGGQDDDRITVNKARIVRLEPIHQQHTACVENRQSTDAQQCHFVATTDDGRQIIAKRVVVAIGAINNHRRPEWAEKAAQSCLANQLTSEPEPQRLLRRRMFHAFDIVHDQQLHQSLPHIFANLRVLVVGGGLTSGHMSLTASRYAKQVSPNNNNNDDDDDDDVNPNPVLVLTLDDWFTPLR